MLLVNSIWMWPLKFLMSQICFKITWFMANGPFRKLMQLILHKSPPMNCRNQPKFVDFIHTYYHSHLVVCIMVVVWIIIKGSSPQIPKCKKIMQSLCQPYFRIVVVRCWVYEGNMVKLIFEDLMGTTNLSLYTPPGPGFYIGPRRWIRDQGQPLKF